MIFKNFRLQIVLRIILLTIVISLTVFLAGEENLRITWFILMAIAIFQVYELIHFVEKTNRKLTQFFQSIRYSDFSTTFTDPHLGKTFRNLNKEFNEVINEFRKNRAEKNEQHNYLLTVVQHINIGIIAFHPDGKVDLFNNSVKKLLRINTLRNVHDLAQIKTELPRKLMAMRAGDKVLTKVIVEDELLQLSIIATQLKLRGKELTLVSLQDIHAELEEKEIESWQKLIRVLTHEIMNSITPISSLVSTVDGMLIDETDERLTMKTLDDEEVQNVREALTTISNRSQGLLNFVDIYRNLTRIPKPNFKHFKISDLFQQDARLLQPKFESGGIDFNYSIDPDNLMVTADPDLVDQILINLLVNAIDAVENAENPKIRMKAFLNKNSRMIVEIADNGCGIKPDRMDKIFMPFYTSKDNGSGIGLSLSRQIMHLHKGNISVRSRPEEGSVFTLTF
ncbi:MAG: GHKL domain-containing protein [Bacteroidales bacterium]|nr:GHKL domain-containing protein [Bacteroidales bacterium]MCF8334771.1 GHKL domain-containing protein [Bacteroidales bacterium]